MAPIASASQACQDARFFANSPGGMCGLPPYLSDGLSRRGMFAITSVAFGCFGFPSYSLMASSYRLPLGPRGFLCIPRCFVAGLIRVVLGDFGVLEILAD